MLKPDLFLTLPSAHRHPECLMAGRETPWNPRHCDLGLALDYQDQGVEGCRVFTEALTLIEGERSYGP